MAILLSLNSHLPNPSISNTPNTQKPPTSTLLTTTSKRHFLLKTSSLAVISLTTQNPLPQSLAESSSHPKPGLSGIANTKSWFQFYGDGFAIRVPPQFEDIMEPEVSLYIYYNVNFDHFNYFAYLIFSFDWWGYIFWLRNWWIMQESLHLFGKFINFCGW